MGYRDWLAVRAPDTNETDFFRLPPDGRTSIVEISRTAFDGNGQPMRVTVTVYPADRNQFIFDFGQVPEQETGREARHKRIPDQADPAPWSSRVEEEHGA